MTGTSNWDYVKGFRPIGSCTLLTEEMAQAQQQDRSIVFQALDKPAYGTLKVLPDMEKAGEKVKKNAILPPVIAAPLEESIGFTYIQPVSVEEVESVRSSGADVSALLNDVMKTVVYEDKTIDPDGYQVRNRVIGVIDNTIENYNAVKTHAALLKNGSRAELMANGMLSVATVNLRPLNQKMAFSFTPSTMEMPEAVSVKDREKEVKDEEKEEKEVNVKEENEVNTKEVTVKDEKENTQIKEEPVEDTKDKTDAPTPALNTAGPVLSSKMIAYSRSRNKAYQESCKRKTITVDDLMQILFKPSRLNPPIALLPSPPPHPMCLSFTPYTESPTYRHGLQLREYQVVSLNWMIQKWRGGEGMILGDEMGLGKTVQVISLLHHFVTVEHQDGPYLVIAPLSTLKNWWREFGRWTNLRVCFYHSEGKGKDERAVDPPIQLVLQGTSREEPLQVQRATDHLRSDHEGLERPRRNPVDGRGKDEAHRMLEQQLQVHPVHHQHPHPAQAPPDRNASPEQHWRAVAASQLHRRLGGGNAGALQARVRRPPQQRAGGAAARTPREMHAAPCEGGGGKEHSTKTGDDRGGRADDHAEAVLQGDVRPEPQLPLQGLQARRYSFPDARGNAVAKGLQSPFPCKGTYTEWGRTVGSSREGRGAREGGGSRSAGRR